MSGPIPVEILVYGTALVSILGCYVLARLGKQLRSNRLRRTAVEDCLLEPPSLHPVINPIRCIGCGACNAACPEGVVLGMIKGKAEIVAPGNCIGHGACRESCPVEAITLVFGTETRGVDIPIVKPNFETDVPGIYIAGELGGMGLIRNAIEQGRQAIESIRRLDGLGRRDRLDVVIVGAGPAGFAASLAAMQHKLRHVTVEQETLGGSIAHYPRRKLVVTAPVQLPLMGKMKFTETTKEALLEFWAKVSEKTGLKPNYDERVESVAPCGDGFEVKTSRDTYRCRAVLLAIGRRGTPRKLGVPGEDLPKVVYRLIEPAQYRGQRVLVVGGGNSALEAAASVANQGDTTVTLSYRGTGFVRSTEKNRMRLQEAEARGRLRVLLSSNVTRIDQQSVFMEAGGNLLEIENDAVIVSAGGVLPTPFLRQMGIRVETKHGTA